MSFIVRDARLDFVPDKSGNCVDPRGRTDPYSLYVLESGLGFGDKYACDNSDPRFRARMFNQIDQEVRQDNSTVVQELQTMLDHKREEYDFLARERSGHQALRNTMKEAQSMSTILRAQLEENGAERAKIKGKIDVNNKQLFELAEDLRASEDVEDRFQKVKMEFNRIVNMLGQYK